MADDAFIVEMRGEGDQGFLVVRSGTWYHSLALPFKPGEHCWIVLAALTLPDPGVDHDFLSNDVVTHSDARCYACGQFFTPEIGAMPCPAIPAPEKP